MPSHAVIALVGTDDEQRTLLRQLLDGMGHASVAFASMNDLITSWHTGKRFNLLMLLTRPFDATLHSLATVLRENAAVPALLAVEQKVLHEMPDRGFFIGSHVDYVALPVDAQRLEWSVRGMLATANPEVPASAQSGTMIFGDFRFLVAERAVLLGDGLKVRLQPREFELALQLFLNMGRMLSREWLWSMLWGREPREGERSLDVCAARVRRALGLRMENGLVLHAVYKRGYRLDAVP